MREHKKYLEGLGDGVCSKYVQIWSETINVGAKSYWHFIGIFVLFKTKSIHLKKVKISILKILLKVCICNIHVLVWWSITAYTRNSSKEMKWKRKKKLCRFIRTLLASRSNCNRSLGWKRFVSSDCLITTTFLK